MLKFAHSLGSRQLNTLNSTHLSRISYFRAFLFFFFFFSSVFSFPPLIHLLFVCKLLEISNLRDSLSIEMEINCDYQIKTKNKPPASFILNAKCDLRREKHKKKTVFFNSSSSSFGVKCIFD